MQTPMTDTFWKDSSNRFRTRIELHGPGAKQVLLLGRWGFGLCRPGDSCEKSCKRVT